MPDSTGRSDDSEATGRSTLTAARRSDGCTRTGLNGLRQDIELK
ncbi:hypothetical protein [Phormidium nigroviride]|nr:hypothetical protein [Oscillatoria nigro-viridis]